MLPCSLKSWPSAPTLLPDPTTHLIKSSSASAELSTTFPAEKSSFCAAAPGWMLTTRMIPIVTAMKVVQR